MMPTPFRKIIVAFVLLSVWGSIQAQTPDSTDVTLRFGSPLISPPDSAAQESVDFILTPLAAAAGNIRDTGDLLAQDLMFFRPDYVTPGMAIHFSALGAGPEGTKFLWRGRPFRNPWTGVADLQFLPPGQIGALRASHFGLIDGALASGGVIGARSAAAPTGAPMTVLMHREGYYAFAPMEFLHSRQIAKGTGIKLTGFFPSSRGRFAHANYTGQTLGAEVNGDYGATHLSSSYVLGKNRVELPFSDTVNSTRREDLDLQAARMLNGRDSVQVGAYLVNESDKAADSARSSREYGLSTRLAIGRVSGFVRVSDISGDQRRDRRLHRTELESSLSYADAVGFLHYQASTGASGWWREGVFPEFALSVEAPVKGLGVLYLQGKQVPNAGSLEEIGRYADNNDGTADARAASVTRAGIFGLRIDSHLGQADLSVFDTYEKRPLISRQLNDGTVVPVPIRWRSAVGWRGIWRYERFPWRSSVQLVAMSRDGGGMTEGDFLIPEPLFRSGAELGWHRRFWNGAFEADVLLSGRYISGYYAPKNGAWELMGGAYPLDFRLTFRIQRFNFYWGLHNWNSYQYYLIPSYRMMHKEEYWGIVWTLMD